MHFMLSLDRSCQISRRLSLLTTPTSVSAINVIIVSAILFVASVRARVIATPEEVLIVEEFKRKILQHMGLSSPPPMSNDTFRNITHIREKHRDQIQDFMQRMQIYHDKLEHSDSDHLESTQHLKLQLKSSDPALTLPIRRINNSDDPSTTKTFHYSTEEFSHWNNPQAKTTIVESAVLRVLIKHHMYRWKRHQFNATDQKIKITVSLRHSDYPLDKPSVVLKSFIVNPFKNSQRIKLDNLKQHLSQHFFSNFSQKNNKKVIFEISASEVAQDEGHLNAIDESSISNNDQTQHQKVDTKIVGTSGMANNSNNSRPILQYSTYSNSYVFKVFPVLEVKISQKDNRSRRVRRSSNNRCNREDRCCRHRIYINFADIGWDNWVLSPEGYSAYFCKGGCPKRYKTASTFSGIRGLLHEKNPDIIPEPTCAASGYNPINLLIFGENNILVETSYPDMVVTGCKCY